METIYKKDGISIVNADCFDLMNLMVKHDKKIDVVLTSPPYCTSRNNGSIKNYEKRYDVFLEAQTNEEYIKWTIDLFLSYDKILKENGTVLYNVSYGSENPSLLWLVVAEIIQKTEFMIADTIVWKKSSALPNNVSHNKLTRITEFVFVFCRKNEYKTFNCNKQVKSTSGTGQKYYENIFNFIEAKNNDGSNDLNKATFSTDLVLKLLNIYAKDDSEVFDSFMGTGTTALGCMIRKIKCIGSELSKDQCLLSKKRLEEEQCNQSQIAIA
jgi:DNA modification methylase